MALFAVIDTNVLVSSFITKDQDSPTVHVLKAIFDGRITPLYCKEIIAEYNEVLHRSKFHLQEDTVKVVLTAFIQFGIEIIPKPSGEILKDMDDLIFYEVTIGSGENNAYLVTGNLKHYPIRDYIITPSEMMKIVNNN